MKKTSKIKMIAVTISLTFLLLIPFSGHAQEIEFNKIEKVALKVFSLKSGRTVWTVGFVFNPTS